MRKGRRSVLLSAGSNSGGQLGVGNDEDSHVLQECRSVSGDFPPTGFSIVQLASGSNHSVAILRPCNEDGDEGSTIKDERTQYGLWASGSGTDGQLGQRMISTTSFRRLDLESDLRLNSLLPFEGGSKPKLKDWHPIRVACGWNSTFVVLRSRHENTDDLLVALGKENDFGQLGVGERKVSESGAERVKLRKALSDEHDVAAIKVTDIACGLRHTLVRCEMKRKSSNRSRVVILGWGAARHGQLDLRVADKAPSVYWHCHQIDEWECDQANAGQSMLSAGKEHSVYYSQGTNSLHVIGSDRQGQGKVVEATEDQAIVGAACTWNATLSLLKTADSEARQIVGSGNNSKGQLGGLGDDGAIVKAEVSFAGGKRLSSLVCGSEHALVLVTSDFSSGGQVWGWGWNEHGNLAQGDEQDRKHPVQIWPPANHTSDQYGSATNVWAGCGTTFVQATTDQ